jgi:hypothetical protein
MVTKSARPISENQWLTTHVNRPGRNGDVLTRSSRPIGGQDLTAWMAKDLTASACAKV